MDRGLGGPQSLSRNAGEEKNSQPLPGTCLLRAVAMQERKEQDNRTESVFNFHYALLLLYLKPGSLGHWLVHNFLSSHSCRSLRKWNARDIPLF